MNLLIPPPLILLISGGVMWVIAKILPGFGFEFALQFRVALVFVAFAIAIDVAAIGLFKRQKTTVNPMSPDKSSVLVKTGIFKFSRNPMYLGMVLILTGFAVWLGNFAAFAVIPVFIWYITRFQIKPEEEMLRNLFGDEYVRYCEEVRRWL